jgi:hypothetical protein
MRSVAHFLVMMALVVTPLLAQTRAPGEEIRRLDSLWARMYEKQDTATALQLYAAKLVFSGANGATKTREQELADVRPTAGLVMHYFRTTPRDITEWRDSAVVTGSAEWQFTWNGQQRTVRRGYRHTYERGGPLGWQIVEVRMMPAAP